MYKKKDGKPLDPEDALAIAIGEIGMSFETFCNLTITEFDKTLCRWAEKRDSEYKDQWERIRLTCYYSVVPHLKSKLSLSSFMGFAWDKNKNTTPAKIKDPERFERLKKEYGEKI